MKSKWEQGFVLFLAIAWDDDVFKYHLAFVIMHD